MEQFREQVKELRRRRGWAQEDLARQINVSLSTVQRWEGKGAKPTRIALYFLTNPRSYDALLPLQTSLGHSWQLSNLISVGKYIPDTDFTGSIK